jgi:hypothetical protein
MPVRTPACFPAKAGIQPFPRRRWAPAFAGEQAMDL